jgi:hypothetical protein
VVARAARNLAILRNARRETNPWTATLSDNMQRPTGPACDACRSVDYDIHTKQAAEWNVGCMLV